MEKIGTFKPKKRPSADEIKRRKERAEIREIFREHAKDQAGPGGISPQKKKEINRITRKNPT